MDGNCQYILFSCISLEIILLFTYGSTEFGNKVPNSLILSLMLNLLRLSTEIKIEISFQSVALFVLILYIPVNNFSVMLGQVFLG